MLATYHNHSNYSDGKASIAELVVAARAQGVGEFGLSDHFTLRPDGADVSWSMPTRRVHEYLSELAAQETPEGPAIRLGLEVDWFEGHADAIGATLADLPLDYIIGSVHYIFDKEIDGSPEHWKRMDQSRVDEVFSEYWKQVRLMAESRLFDIAAHLDLPKKFGFASTCDVSGRIADALDAIAAAGMVVELNTAGWHKPCNDAYPTLEIFQQCRARGIPVTLSADAHDPDHLLRDFDRGAERLAAAGYEEVARFKNRARRMEPLESAVPV